MELQFEKQQWRYWRGSDWCVGPGIRVLILCEIESVSKYGLNMGWGGGGRV